MSDETQETVSEWNCYGESSNGEFDNPWSEHTQKEVLEDRDGESSLRPDHSMFREW